MAKSDYYRPAPYQIQEHYACSSCGHEIQIESTYAPAGCQCGGVYEYRGESYPASPDDWDEERGEDGDWHRRR